MFPTRTVSSFAILFLLAIFSSDVCAQKPTIERVGAWTRRTWDYMYIVTSDTVAPKYAAQGPRAFLEMGSGTTFDWAGRIGFTEQVTLDMDAETEIYVFDGGLEEEEVPRYFVPTCLDGRAEKWPMLYIGGGLEASREPYSYDWWAKWREAQTFSVMLTLSGGRVVTYEWDVSRGDDPSNTETSSEEGEREPNNWTGNADGKDGAWCGGSRRPIGAG